MVPFAIPVAMSIGAALCGWLLEVRIIGNRISVRQILALMLLAASTWLSTVIVVTEYWLVDDHNARFLFHVIAVFVVLGSLIIATAVGVFTVAAIWPTSSIPKWRLCVVPILSLAAFALVLYLVNSRAFFPSA